MYTGQFWNIPITFEPLNYTGSNRRRIEEHFDTEQLYAITVHPPTAPARTFVGELYWRSWEQSDVRCYYAGSSQGGATGEFEEPSGTVIQGKYFDYQVNGLFDITFKYSMFDKELCQ